MKPLAHGDELKRVAKGAATTLIGKVAGGGLHYLYTMIVARFLGAELLGLYFLGWTLVNVAGVVAKLGLDNGALRFVALYYGEKDTARVKGTILQALKLGAVSSLAICGLLLAASGFIADRIFHKPELSSVIRILSLSLPFWTVMMLALYTTQAFQIMKYNVYVQHLFVPIATLASTLLVFFMGFRLYGVLAVSVFGTLFGMMLALYFLRRVFPEIRGGIAPIFETKRLLAYSSPLLLVGFLNFSLLWIDILMLGYYRTAAEVGIYSSAVRTALLTILILTAFNSIFAPMMSDLFNRKEMVKLEMLFKTITQWIFLFGLTYFLMIVLFAKEILSLFGPEFTAGAFCLTILTGSQLVNAATGSVGYMLMMSGRQNVSLGNQIFTVALNVILNILLIPQWGMVGAAVATGIALSAINLMALAEVYWFYGFHPYHKEFLKPLAAGGLAFAVLLYLKGAVGSMPGLITLAFGVPLFLFIQTAVLYLLGFSREDRLILEGIKKRVFPSRGYSMTV